MSIRTTTRDNGDVFVCAYFDSWNATSWTADDTGELHTVLRVQLTETVECALSGRGKGALAAVYGAHQSRLREARPNGDEWREYVAAVRKAFPEATKGGES